MTKRCLALCIVCLLATGCAPRHDGPAIVVASGTSEEALLLGSMALTLLDGNGYPTRDRTGLGSPDAIRAAVLGGSADLYWAYTADVWSQSLRHQEPLADGDLLFRRVRDEDAANGIVWLGPIPAESRLALLVTPALAVEAGLVTTSDLVGYQTRVNPALRICAPQELRETASGVRGLERVYGLRFEGRGVASPSFAEGYRALEAGECDCALGITNDPPVRLGGLVILADDLAFFPPSNLALGVRAERLETYPELEDLLTRLIALVDEESLAALDRQVTVHAMEREGAVRAFLRRGELMPSRPTVPASGG